MARGARAARNGGKARNRGPDDATDAGGDPEPRACERAERARCRDGARAARGCRWRESPRIPRGKEESPADDRRASRCAGQDGGAIKMSAARRCVLFFCAPHGRGVVAFVVASM